MNKKRRTGIIVLFALLLISAELVNAQPLPNYWGDLKPGKFSVGFKSICVFDTNRKYDLAVGDSTVVLKNKNLGRPVLLNIWYPAKKSNHAAVLKVKDYFDFPTDENTRVFFAKLKEFQIDYSQLYSTDQNIKKKDLAGDTSLLESTRKKIFEEYISANTITHRNAIAADGEYPVVIYHHGIGGTTDENNLLAEYLASNGYIVINSAYQSTDTDDVGTGDQQATFDDLNFIINYCRQNISKNKKYFLIGHSYGANSIIGFPGEGHQNIDGIVPLDSDFGYNFYNFLPSKYNPFAKEKLKFYNIPILCIGRSEALYKMIDSFSLSKRFYLTMSGMRHNDFTSQGAIGRYHCIPYVNEKDRYTEPPKNYRAMCAVVLQFLNKYAKDQGDFNMKNVSLRSGWKFEVAGPGEKIPFNAPFDRSKTNCPTISQLLDIIYNTGVDEAEKACAQCPDSMFRNNFSDMLEAIYVDKGAAGTISYLDWMNKKKVVEKSLRGIFSIVAYHSFWERGNGFHFDKARQLFQWMIDNYPNNEYGYMGMLLVVSYTSGDTDFYSKKIAEIDPNYKNRKGKSFEENKIIGIVDKYLKKRN